MEKTTKILWRKVSIFPFSTNAPNLYKESSSSFVYPCQKTINTTKASCNTDLSIDYTIEGILAYQPSIVGSPLAVDLPALWWNPWITRFTMKNTYCELNALLIQCNYVKLCLVGKPPRYVIVVQNPVLAQGMYFGESSCR